MEIADLISDIRTQDLVLPEFQREFIWRRPQMRELMFSLTQGYPIGSLLFWKTDHPPQLKNIHEPPDKLGTVQVILDGQQRLTTLYLLIRGEIPHYYGSHEIKYDPRSLHYNLRDGSFQYYQKTLMEGDPLWQRVVDCFDTDHKINVFRIAKKVASGDNSEPFELAQRLQTNLDRLRHIREKDLPVQYVPTDANITAAIDIFDRVNSQGTKLTDAELALTHVCGKWPNARQVMKDKLAELEKEDFSFDLTFMTRAMTAIVTGRAAYSAIHDRRAEELQEGWERLSKRLDYLVGILPSEACIHGTDDLTTPNVLVPLIRYLELQEGNFPSDKELRRALHWLYAAQAWARYTAQTDQRLEHDLSIVNEEPSPWSSLCDRIIDQRGRIEVKAADLEGRWITHPLYKIAAVVAKAHGAVDWFNGASLGTAFGDSYKLHSHHIFPRNLLYNDGYDSDNHLHRKIVNEIANRAFLTAESNLKLQDTPPADYLPDVEERYPGALAKQFVPMKPELWKTENFREFLAARRELIAQKINEFMECLVAEEEEVTPERTADELRQLSESVKLEFKSTLRWDVVQEQVNRNLQFSVLKTIAAFMNSSGGTLVIGVEDDGSIYGLEQDLKTLKDSTDIFEQTLVNLVVQHIGAEFAALVEVRFEEVEGKQVCVVDVDPAGGPAYLHTPRGKELYVRFGNTSRSLDPQETVSYVETQWA